MKKRSIFIIILILFFLILFLGFSSANLFSNVWNKLTGNIITGEATSFQTCVQLGFDGYRCSQEKYKCVEAGKEACCKDTATSQWFEYRNNAACNSEGSSSSTESNLPVGKIEYSNCVGAYGYTYDSNNLNTPLRIDIWLVKSESGNSNLPENIYLGSYYANKYWKTGVPSNSKSHGFKIVWNRDLNQDVARQYLFDKTRTISLYAIDIDSSGNNVASSSKFLGNVAFDKCLEEYYYSLEETQDAGLGISSQQLLNRVLPGPHMVMTNGGLSDWNLHRQFSALNNLKEIPPLFFFVGFENRFKNGGKQEILSRMRSVASAGFKYVVVDEIISVCYSRGTDCAARVKAFNEVRDTIKSEYPGIKIGIVEGTKRHTQRFFENGGRTDFISGEDYTDSGYFRWNELSTYRGSYTLQEWVLGADKGNEYLGKVNNVIYIDSHDIFLYNSHVIFHPRIKPYRSRGYFNSIVDNMIYLFSDTCFAEGWTSTGDLEPGLINWNEGSYNRDFRFICDSDGRFKRCTNPADPNYFNTFSSLVNVGTKIGEYTCNSDGIWVQAREGQPCVNMSSKYVGSPGKLGLRNVYDVSTSYNQDPRFICGLDGKFYRCMNEPASSSEWNSFSVSANNNQVIGNYTCEIAKNKWLLKSEQIQCSNFIYSDWSVCVNNLKTREIISSSPSGCVGGNPILSQICLPFCIESDWQSTDSSCTSHNQTTRTWIRIKNCTETGGISKPNTEVISCLYNAPICIGFNYSDWSECFSNGLQSRSILSSSPNGCQLGTPENLTRKCNFTPSLCEFIYSDWSECLDLGIRTRSLINSSPKNCQGNPILIKDCIASVIVLNYSFNNTPYIGESSNSGNGNNIDNISEINNSIINRHMITLDNSNIVKYTPIKSFFVKTICKISHIFKKEEQYKCVNRFL